MSKHLLASELADKFLDIEKKYKLLELKLENGLYFWDIVRYYSFIHLLEITGNFVPSKKTRDYFSMTKAIVNIANTILNELFFVLSNKKCDVIFYCSSRNIGKDNTPEDVVLKDCINSLNQSKYFIEATIHPNYKGTSKFNSRYFLFSLNLLLKKKNSVQHEDTLLKVASILTTEFGFKTNWVELFRQLLFRFQQEVKIYNRIFKKKKPKTLIFISNNLPKALVYSAKKAGVYTVEMQHGALTKAAVSDRYDPSVKNLNLPTIHDAYLTFSDYWDDRISNVFKVRAIGNSYYYLKPKPPKKNNVYTFISGKFTFPVLFTFAKELAQNCPDKKFYYKLHTSEIDNVEEATFQSNSISNLEIIYTSKNVTQLYKESSGVILIQSTCAYEALQSGLDVFIIKKLYYKESEELFPMRNVFLISSTEDFKAAITNRKTINEDRKEVPEFFAPFDKDVFVSFLKKNSPLKI